MTIASKKTIVTCIGCSRRPRSRRTRSPKANRVDNHKARFNSNGPEPCKSRYAEHIGRSGEPRHDRNRRKRFGCGRRFDARRNGARRQHRLCSINRPGRCFAVKPERVYSDDLRALGRGEDRWRDQRRHPRESGSVRQPRCRPAAAIGSIANLIGGAIGIFISNGDGPGENGGFLIGNGAPGSAGQDGGNGGLIGNGGNGDVDAPGGDGGSGGTGSTNNGNDGVATEIEPLTDRVGGSIRVDEKT
jgi:hypothetical protein